MSCPSLRCPTCTAALAPPTDDLVPGRVYVGTCGECKADVKFRLAAPPSCGLAQGGRGAVADPAAAAVPIAATADISFILNGEAVTAKGADPTMTLNDWLRFEARMKGTKKSCGEGGCGACIVTIEKEGVAPIAANSCLRLLGSVHGWAVTTIEGIGSREKGYHPIQAALAKGKSSSGTQCGYCSPGMVMNMYSLLQNDSKPSEAKVGMTSRRAAAPARRCMGSALSSFFHTLWCCTLTT